MSSLCHRLVLCLCLALLACSGADTEVRLDLCASPAATPEETGLLRQVSNWFIDVLGIETNDVAWRRSWAGTDEVTSLTVSGAIPPGEEIRLLVEGFGLDHDNRQRVLAVAASGILTVNGGERVCLCVAPPESYDTLCVSWQCSFNTATGQCVIPD